MVLFVGALRTSYRQKGVDYLIRAMASVRLQVPNAKLIVVGGGGLQAKLETLAKSLGLGREVVTFMGQVTRDKVPSFYALCDVFVLPASAEAYGFVLLEAMAAGKPVITCEIPGAGEVVEHGVTGLKVRPKDSIALAEAIISLLTNTEAAGQMGQRGYDWVRKRTWMDVAKDTLAVYEEVTR